MRPKKELTNEQKIFVNVSNKYAKKNGLKLKDTLPYLFQVQFRETISYTTLSKFINNDEIDIKYQNELLSTSNN